ncbi:hypothetical protein [Nereida sp. MMG025]|uniref:hypothetical protein n=1 Tax=Nereida sp. MMG025 TaxID=2909981 RepID=UPI001F40E9F8|nr:hypothetical protein [Nereida sp. MMG025]MCF6445741.1 hypothetical protein [Nereida sp. MMG025]
MADLTVDEAILWVAGNGGGVGDSMVPLMNSQRALQDPRLDPQSRQMHESIIDHHMGRVSEAKQQADIGQMASDPEFASAVCNCKPGEPCCMTGGEIIDADDSSRKLTWPVAGSSDPTKMYVIANRMQGRNLVGRVDTKIEADPCGLSPAIEQGLNARGILGGTQKLPTSQTESMISARGGVVTTSNNFLALFLPDKFVTAAFAVDALLTGFSVANPGEGATFTPVMCMPEAGMGASLTVIPVPEVKLTGEGKAGIMIQFRPLGGISANTTIEGNIKGKFGTSEFEVKAEGKAESVGSSQLQSYSPEGESGMKKMVGSMIQRMGGFVADSASGGDPRTSVNVGSGVQFDMIFAIGATGIELKAKSASPDLDLKFGSVTGSVELKVEGRIDLIEIAVAILLTPAAARTLNRAREEANKSDRAFRGEARCDLTVGAGGKLEHEVEVGGTYQMVANGEDVFTAGAYKQELKGKVQITGSAVIAIRAEAKVWRATASAGAAGGVHTSWTWEMRKKSDESREWRYFFEGVRARAVLYADLSIGRDNSGRGDDDDAPSIEGLSGSTGVEASQSVAGTGSDSGMDFTKPHPDDRFIVDPTVPKVTSSNPPWQKY